MSLGGIGTDTPAANHPPEVRLMQYLPLFLLFMAVLIAAYFYLQRAKSRDVVTTPHDEAPAADVATDERLP